MPSPIAHSAAAYVLYRYFGFKADNGRCVARVPMVFLLSILVCMAPDLDAVAGLLAGDLSRFHNSFAHSLSMGFVAASGVWLAARAARVSRPGVWFFLTLACYESHVIMDAFTIGRGTLLFWPFYSERVQPPFWYFYGVRWSHGLWTPLHLWTAATEILFALVIIYGTRSRRPVLRRLLNALFARSTPSSSSTSST